MDTAGEARRSSCDRTDANPTIRMKMLEWPTNGKLGLNNTTPVPPCCHYMFLNTPRLKPSVMRRFGPDRGPPGVRGLAEPGVHARWAVSWPARLRQGVVPSGRCSPPTHSRGTIAGPGMVRGGRCSVRIRRRAGRRSRRSPSPSTQN